MFVLPIFFLYRCANILEIYLSFVFVCTVSLTFVSNPTSRRFIRWLLFQTYIYIIAELDCCQIIILSIYVPSTHAYTHVLRISLDLPYETR
jgi:hypothetical protein